jgi:hypothetical protein
VALDGSPGERRALASVFLERIAKRRNRLLKPRRPAFALAEPDERTAEIGLGRRPVKRHALTGAFLERGAKRGDRLLKPRRPALALPEYPKRKAEIVLL